MDQNHKQRGSQKHRSSNGRSVDQNAPQHHQQLNAVAAAAGANALISWENNQRPSPPSESHNISSSQATSMDSGRASTTNKRSSSSEPEGLEGNSGESKGQKRPYSSSKAEYSDAVAVTAAAATVETGEAENIKKKRRRGKQRKKGDDLIFSVSKPKRPRTAYNFFVRDERPKIVNQLNERKARAKPGENSQGSSFENIGKVLGHRWNSLDSATKAKYEQLAKEDTNRYTDETKNFYTKMYLHPDIAEAAEKTSSTLQFQVHVPSNSGTDGLSQLTGKVQQQEPQQSPPYKAQSLPQSQSQSQSQAQTQQQLQLPLQLFQQQQPQQSMNFPQVFQLGGTGQNFNFLLDSSQNGGSQQMQNMLSNLQFPQAPGFSNNQGQQYQNQMLSQEQPNFGQSQFQQDQSRDQASSQQSSQPTQAPQLFQSQLQQFQGQVAPSLTSQNSQDSNTIDMNNLLTQYAGYLNNPQALFSQFQGVFNQFGQQQQHPQLQFSSQQPQQQVSQTRQLQQQMAQSQERPQQQIAQPQEQPQQKNQFTQQQDSRNMTSATSQSQQLQSTAKLLQGFPLEQLGNLQNAVNAAGAGNGCATQNPNAFGLSDQQGQQNIFLGSFVQSSQAGGNMNYQQQQTQQQQNQTGNQSNNNSNSNSNNEALTNQTLQQWLWSLNQGNQNN